MRAHLPVVAAAAALLLVSVVPPAARAAEPAAEVASVPLDLTSRVPAVEVWIGGDGPFRFLVDTAVEGTAVHDPVAVRLGLEGREHAWLGPPGGADSVEGMAVRLPSLRLGDLERNLDGVRLDLAEITGGDPPDGILGRAFFAGHLWTLDYPEQRLVVRRGQLPPPDGVGVLSYDLPEGRAPTIRIDVAGTEVRAELASLGFGGVALPQSFQEQLPLEAEAGMIGRTRTSRGLFALHGARLDGDVRVGGLVLERPRILFSEAFETVNLGPAVLEEWSLTFDDTNRRVAIERKPGRRLALLTEEAAAVRTLDGTRTLREEFNRGKDKVRMLLILSPT